MKKTVAILHGALAEGAPQDEQDTLVQVDAVSEALSQLGLRPVSVPLSLNLEAAVETLQQVQPDFVFNLVESVSGQGRLIHLGPSLLDALQLAYTGAGTEAMLLTSNKLVAKQWLHMAGIATPEWWSQVELSQDFPVKHVRYIVKSVWEHASVGLSKDSVVWASSSEELRMAAQRRKPLLGDNAFVEVFVDGREFNVAMLTGESGPEVLPLAEIRFDAFPEDKLKIVDYRAKWEVGSFEYHQTPRTFKFAEEDAQLLSDLRKLAQQCWQLFGLRGYARVDFRIDEAQQPYVLEINTNPCLSPDAGFMAAAEQAGLSLTDLIQRIIQEVT